MNLNLLLLKWGAIIVSGAFFSLTAYLFIIRPKKPAKAEAEPAKMPVKKDFKNSLAGMISILEANPKSKESSVIRRNAGAAVFVVMFLITMKFLFALLLSLAVFFFIGFYFNGKIKKKNEVFDSQLIEALGTIANSVRAGQSLMQALENMVNEAKDPLKSEFANALKKVRLGISVNDALNGLTENNKSKDLRIVITSINMARETGGNLGEILSGIADTMRERRKIQGKINSLTAQGKMSGTFMGSVPFIMLAILYLIEPEMMGLLFSTFLGNLMLSIAVIMVALGMFFINKIINIDI